MGLPKVDLGRPVNSYALDVSVSVDVHTGCFAEVLSESVRDGAAVGVVSCAFGDVGWTHEDVTEADHSILLSLQPWQPLVLGLYRRHCVQNIPHGPYWDILFLPF